MFLTTEIEGEMVFGGDGNTNFFHALASVRSRRNLIDSLKVNYYIIENSQGIREKVVRFFKNLYGNRKVIELRD